MSNPELDLPSDVVILPVSKAAKRIIHEFLEVECMNLSPRQASFCRRRLLGEIRRCCEAAKDQTQVRYSAAPNMSLVNALVTVCESMDIEAAISSAYYGCIEKQTRRRIAHVAPKLIELASSIASIRQSR